MYILLLVSAALYSLTVVRPFLPVDMYAAYLGLYLYLIRRTLSLVGFVLLLYTLCRLCHGWVKSV